MTKEEYEIKYRGGIRVGENERIGGESRIRQLYDRWGRKVGLWDRSTLDEWYAIKNK